MIDQPSRTATFNQPGGVIMNRVYRLLTITIVGALITVLSGTLGFAQQDNVTIKRTVGDFYDITISGERNGDFAEVGLLTKERRQFLLNAPAGPSPTLLIYALVTSGGNANATTNYSMTIQEKLPGPAWIITYYVTDNYNDFVMGNFNFDSKNSIAIRDYYPNNDHFNDGYYFDVDLTGSSFEPQPGGVVTIHNLKVEGFEDPFWAIIQWNPRNLKFELNAAGPEN